MSTHTATPHKFNDSNQHGKWKVSVRISQKMSNIRSVQKIIVLGSEQQHRKKKLLQEIKNYLNAKMGNLYKKLWFSFHILCIFMKASVSSVKNNTLKRREHVALRRRQRRQERVSH